MNKIRKGDQVIVLANGQVWLLNPNGVLIGRSGEVQAAGFLATTLAIDQRDFIEGRFRFSARDGAQGIIGNEGAIRAATGGYAVLSGRQVGNDGLISARLGHVVLGAASTMTLDLVGDQLLGFALSGPVAALPADGRAVITNSGRIEAAGGHVVLSARAATNIMTSVINTSGVIDATSVNEVNGVIVLDGGNSGTVNVAGTLDASGLSAGQTGGTVRLAGDTLQIRDGARIDVRGDAGGGAIYAGGGWQGADIDGRLASVRLTIDSGAVLDASAVRSRVRRCSCSDACFMPMTSCVRRSTADFSPATSQA